MEISRFRLNFLGSLADRHDNIAFSCWLRPGIVLMPFVHCDAKAARREKWHSRADCRFVRRRLDLFDSAKGMAHADAVIP
jgi:hypothetical protein